MLKHKKQPTTQELYQARIKREEEERNANLPPGLINHGNTCFMNSTLQGLIATPLLHSLIDFAEPSGSDPHLLARRSPQLTNGHGRGGTSEQEWEQGMPLGDVFVKTMQRAWDIQQNNRRESMSPKDLLTTIGRKYDQYLDFRQQDAHEFLRHMLDAMRMEELDVIKKRQPPPPKPKRRQKKNLRRPRATDGNAVSEAPLEAATQEIPEEERLESFVDMLFGGKLASILVCDACKKVSVTHEDFNDLSLSIKPEDYVKERKRDRLKLLAKKLRLRPKDSPSPTSVAMHRSSSLPASPVRRSIDPLPHEVEPPVNVDHRRRSFDHVSGAAPDGDKDSSDDAKDRVEEGQGNERGVTPPAAGGEASPEVPEAKTPHVEFSETVLDKEKKPKDDAWGKLSRRLSISMGMSKKDKRRSRSKEAGWGRSRHSKDKEKDTDTSRPPSVERPPISKRHSHSGHVDSTSDFSEASEFAKSRVVTPSPNPSPLASPALNVTGPFPNVRKATALSLGERRGKSPRPPKPSRQETAYLRQLLADVHPSSPGPLSMLQHALGGGSQSSLGLPSSPMSSQTLLAKLGHLPGIEECLRLFTAVEVLDGENMVGCHRCWKIANGTYKPKEQEEKDEDTDGSSEETPIVLRGNFAETNQRDSSPEGIDHISPASTSIIASSATSQSSSFFLNDNASASSAPTTVQTTPTDAKPLLTTEPASRPSTPPPKTPEAPVPSYGGLPIPSISTTGPDTPGSTARSTDETELPGSASNGSLVPPRVRKRHHERRRGSDGSSSSFDGYDSSDVSGDDSAYSEASSIASASPSVSPRTSAERLPPQVPPESTKPRNNGKIPRSQQVILRKTYKRYLIATPPPILVVHLKRFQQISKSNPYAMAFSGGFKKLEDFVSFPEYLDVTPFLAPKKEDYGLGRKGEGKDDEKTAAKPERCMYRLYAVVVHIGNMLGGHYIAYTALPPSTSSSRSSTRSDAPADPDAASQATSERTSSPSNSRHPRQWAYISDTVVRLTTLEEVLKAKAYICMYERL